MAALKLSWSERRALRRLVGREIPAGDIKADHLELFLAHGLVEEGDRGYILTLRGQLEILRQRYRGVRPAKPTS